MAMNQNARVDPPHPPEDLDLREMLDIVGRHRALVFGSPLAFAVIVFLITLIVPPTFTATASFVAETPTTGRIPAGLAGLASQLGLSLGSDASFSPHFYANVITSRALLQRALLARHADARVGATAPDSQRLLDLVVDRGKSFRDSMERGTDRLEDLVSARVDNQTGIVRVLVDSRYPAVAARIANDFMAYLNEFNATTRQSQARERRKFAEQRLADAEGALRNAEEALRVFYERNRSWQQAPGLVFEEGRLRRQVEIMQGVYLTLRQEYETARIQEVNETPVITVIDSAVVPLHKSRPRRRILIPLGFLLGGGVGLLGAFGTELIGRVRRRSTTLRTPSAGASGGTPPRRDA